MIFVGMMGSVGGNFAAFLKVKQRFQLPYGEAEMKALGLRTSRRKLPTRAFMISFKHRSSWLKKVLVGLAESIPIQ